MQMPQTYLKPLFALTLFVSAALMFSVQPMIGKALLPLLGGSPSVWNTAMVFFQILLLGGYFYAFLLSRIPSLRTQGLIHAGLVVAAAAVSLPLVLPLAPALAENLSLDNPASWQISLMATMIAGPFFVLAASAPLLQRWFSLSGHKGASSPYSLYVASNVGSLLALLAYPFVAEPFLRLGSQATLWSGGYVLLALLLAAIFCAAGFMAKKAPLPASSTPALTVAAKGLWGQRALWLFLAFVPSSLMLGYTTYVTTDVTSAPLFWVVPLALYLVTFIIAFAERPLLRIEGSRSLQAVFLMCFLWFAMAVVNPSRFPILLIHGGLFFFTALVCHQELAKAKPPPERLTEFYLFMSLGGALGGIFNSLIAPQIFPLPYEYMIAVLLGVFARMITDPESSLRRSIHRASAQLGPKSRMTLLDFLLFPGLMILGCLPPLLPYGLLNTAIACVVVLLAFRLHEQRWPFALTIVVIALANPLIPWKSWSEKILVDRNFYGVHMVSNEGNLRKLTHGTTIHGAQALEKPFNKIPITYYYAGSGAEDAFSLLDERPGPQRIAAMGLGSGSIACFWKGGRKFDFYEIDPAIARIATNKKYFTYLSDCGSGYRIIMGDARQQIARADDHSYDMIFVDVFSSDNIPVHILTKEAVALYTRKLKPDGFLVFHTSNRFFRLEPEIAAIGKELGLHFQFKISSGGIIPHSDIPFFPTRYAVLTGNPQILLSLSHHGWGKLPYEVTQEPWSDNYANVLRALRF